MKIYLNPQPHAVERTNQLKNIPSTVPMPRQKKEKKRAQKNQTPKFLQLSLRNKHGEILLKKINIGRVRPNKPTYKLNNG